MRRVIDAFALIASLAAVIYGLLNWQGAHGRIDVMAIVAAVVGVFVLKSVLFSIWWRRRKARAGTAQPSA